MASPRETDLSDGRETREASVSDLFKYEISYGIDQTLQWDPPASSRELAIALSYHFPTEKDLEAKMKAATKKFMREERRKTLDASAKKVSVSSISETKPPGHDVSHPRSPKVSSRQVTASPTRQGAATASHLAIPATRKPKNFASPKTFKMLTWDPLVKGFKGSGGKKRRYEKKEGEKVAANRGYACDEHRRQKIKCDPEVCPRNRQRLRLQGAGRETVTERKESSCPSAGAINSEICTRQEPTKFGVGLFGLSADSPRISSQPGPGTEQPPVTGPPMSENPADIDPDSIVTRGESRGDTRTEDRVPSFPPPACLPQSKNGRGGISNEAELEFTHVNPLWLDTSFMPDHNDFVDKLLSSPIIPYTRSPGILSPINVLSSSSLPPIPDPAMGTYVAGSIPDEQRNSFWSSDEHEIRSTQKIPSCTRYSVTKTTGDDSRHPQPDVIVPQDSVYWINGNSSPKEGARMPYSAQPCSGGINLAPHNSADVLAYGKADITVEHPGSSRNKILSSDDDEQIHVFNNDLYGCSTSSFDLASNNNEISKLTRRKSTDSNKIDATEFHNEILPESLEELHNTLKWEIEQESPRYHGFLEEMKRNEESLAQSIKDSSHYERQLLLLQEEMLMSKSTTNPRDKMNEIRKYRGGTPSVEEITAGLASNCTCM